MKVGSVIATIGITTVLVSAGSVGLGRLSRYRHDKKEMLAKQVATNKLDSVEFHNKIKKSVDFFDFKALYDNIKSVRDYSAKKIIFNNEKNISMIKTITQK